MKRSRVGSKAGLAGLFLIAACGGNGPGDGEGKVRGIQLVAGDGLKIKDVSDDGTLIAYSNAADKIFLIPAAGGDPTEVAAGADEIEFRGNVLVLFKTINDLNQTAQTVQFVKPGSTTAVNAGASNIKIDSVRASEDDNHIFFETADGAFFDDVAIVSGASQIRGRFTADNQFLIVAFNPIVNAESAVQAFPLAGGAPINLPGCPAGCSSRFQVSNAGQQVIFGADEAGDLANLTVVNANGQGGAILAAGGSDNGFIVAEDSETLFFVDAPFGGQLASIGIDGSNPRVLGPEGVVDIIAANATAVVYATAIENISGLLDLRIVGADGAGDSELAVGAKDEGFSSDGAFYLFQDNILGKAGTLKFTSTQAFSVQQIAAGVDKASFQNSTKVFFIDGNDLLQTVDLSTNTVTLFEDFVNKFEILRPGSGDATQVAFTVPNGSASGLYINDL